MSWKAERWNNSYKNNRDAQNIQSLIDVWEEPDYILYDRYIMELKGGCGYEECCPGSEHFRLDQIYASFFGDMLQKLGIESAGDLVVSYLYTR